MFNKCNCTLKGCTLTVSDKSTEPERNLTINKIQNVNISKKEKEPETGLLVGFVKRAGEYGGYAASAVGFAKTAYSLYALR